MRRTLLATCLLVFILSPGVLQAQVHVGPQASYADETDLGIGARVGVELPTPNLPLEAMASFDYFFPSGTAGADMTYWEINGNLVYKIPVKNSAVSPYAGAGLNLAHASIDNIPFVGTASSTDMGLNLLGGARFKAGNISPFGEARFTLGGGEQFVLTGGVMFQVGPGFK